MKKIPQEPLVHPGARVAPDAVIGPRAIIGPDVIIEEGCVIGSDVSIESAHIGPNTRIGPHCIIGAPSPALAFPGTDQPGHSGAEENSDEQHSQPGAGVYIGRSNALGGYTILYQGHGTRPTIVGDNNNFFTYVRIESGAVVGSGCLFQHEVTVWTNCIIEDHVSIGALSEVAPGLSVGRYASIAVKSKVETCVPPFMAMKGAPARIVGPNYEQMALHGFSSDFQRKVGRLWAAASRYRPFKRSRVLANG